MGGYRLLYILFQMGMSIIQNIGKMSSACTNVKISSNKKQPGEGLGDRDYKGDSRWRRLLRSSEVGKHRSANKARVEFKHCLGGFRVGDKNIKVAAAQHTTDSPGLRTVAGGPNYCGDSGKLR